MNYAKKDEILRDFVKLIKFYNAKSVVQYSDFFDDMDGLLTLFLLEMIQSQKCISKRYVAVCLRNEYYRISKKFLALCRNRAEFTEFCKTDNFTINSENEMLVKDALASLTNKQNEVVKLRFWKGYTCNEIATLKGVSRQAINQTQKKALDNLKAVF